MVFFSCDGCAEMLKKNQVDVHARKCRRCYSVSCVDCNVSFPGDEYRAHTSCMTEVERYEKTGPGVNKRNKKMTPQQVWMELINSSIPTAPSHLKQHLVAIAGYDNIPRKEKQFRNFASNSLVLPTRGKQNEGLVKEIWNYLTKQREQQKLTTSTAKNNGNNINSNNSTKQPSNVISSGDDDDDDNNNTDEENDNKNITKHQPTNRTATSNKNKSLISSAFADDHDTSNLFTTSSPKDDANDDKIMNTKTDAEIRIDSKKKMSTSIDDSNSNTKTIPDKKTVKKAMKKVLKQAKNNSLSMKKLRKAIADYIQQKSAHVATTTNVINKDQWKQLIRDIVISSDTNKHFIMDGKTITLKM